VGLSGRTLSGLGKNQKGGIGGIWRAADILKMECHRGEGSGKDGDLHTEREPYLKPDKNDREERLVSGNNEEFDASC